MAGSSLRVRLEVRRAGQGATPGFALAVDLELRPGITIVFGPSGAGKSTLLQAIAGLERPDHGHIALGDEVWFDGDRGVEVAAHRRHVAYVFQGLALFPHFTALGNVAYGVARSVPRAARRARAHALLERLRVGHLAERKPRTFSGGEAQRVALARAMAMNPRVMLLDEPFSALDRDLRIELAREVRGVVDELGIPAIQVTHNRGEARAMGDRVVRLAAGRVAQEGSVAEVLGPREGDAATESNPGLGRASAPDETPMPELRRR